MATMELSTVEEALAYLKGGDGAVLQPTEIKFSGELAGFRAIIDGPNYHSTVPAALARGLWEFQEELYRAVAFALYGDNNIRRLTDEEKADYELIFEVTEGSTDLLASLEGFFSKLGDGFQTMDSNHKMRTLIAIAVILAGTYGAIQISSSLAEVKTKEIAAAVVKTQEDAKTEQFELIAEIAGGNPIVNRFAKASEEGTRAIIKGASDATKIKVGRTNFSREDIVEVNQRATKERPQALMMTGEYQVVRADVRDGGVTRFWMVNADGLEFSGIIVDEDFDAKGLNRLWEAVRSRSKIKLEINATVIRGQIKNASILSVVG